MLFVMVMLVKIVSRNELDVSFGGNKFHGVFDDIRELRNRRNIEGRQSR